MRGIEGEEVGCGPAGCYTARPMNNLLMKIGSHLVLILSISAVNAADPPPAQPQQPAQQQPRAPRPQPPGRDPNTEGFVKAKELEDGAVPSPDEDGNFIIGPTHKKAPELTVKEGVPRGMIHSLTMKSEDSKIYPGITREKGTFGTPDPNNPAKLNVTSSHAAAYTRKVAVYVPRQYEAGTEAPFIVGADGP